MFEIENAKRLLPSNCQNKPATGNARLYELLESNMYEYEKQQEQKQLKEKEEQDEVEIEDEYAGPDDLMF